MGQNLREIIAEMPKEQQEKVALRVKALMAEHNLVEECSTVQEQAQSLPTMSAETTAMHPAS
ncbi:MAG: hypothetical protein F6J87_28505 [Spirulina sp. SIO3F2]|nr:hypothetical protein [Spirulina sp. SIO3F2]